MKLPIPGQSNLEINKDDYEFLQKIVDSDFVGLIGGSQVRYWQWNNLTKIAEKVRQRSKELNLNPQKIAPKFVKEFFDNASLEENDDMQDMWTNLLLNQATDKSVNVYYISILNKLDPAEARLLSVLYSQSNSTTNTTFLFASVLKAFPNINSLDLKIMIYKLYSFNILRPPLMEGIGAADANGDIYRPPLETTDSFRFSDMGLDFCKKCDGVN